MLPYILERDKCTGCLLCQKVCPKNSIEVIYDKLGFPYPKPNLSCIECEECRRICPQINEVKAKSPKQVFMAKGTDKQEIEGCSSGGIALIAGKYVISNGGVYYAAISKENGIVEHVRLTKVDNTLDSSKGSKYIQSSISNIYLQLECDINGGKFVLFIGTPCQVAAIKKMTNDPYNLLTISFPCGGVGSPKIIFDEIEEKKDIPSIGKIRFRDHHKAFIEVTCNNKIQYFKLREESPFWYTYDKKYCVRDACLSCQYSRKNRIEDLTIGDFWGAEPNSIFSLEEIENAVSFIFLNTDKGESFFEVLQHKLKISKDSYENVKKQNPRLNCSIREDSRFNMRKRKNFLKKWYCVGLHKALLREPDGKFVWYKIKAFVKYKLLRRGY